MNLDERIEKAIARIVSGDAPMRIPVDETDPDIVLLDCQSEIARLRGALNDAHHYGHAIWCDAIKGPEGENWYEHEDCTCKRKHELLHVNGVSIF